MSMGYMSLRHAAARPPPPIRKVRCIRHIASKGVGHNEPRIRTNQLTNSIPVSAIESLDIKLHDASDFRAGDSGGFRLKSSGGELCSRTIKGGLNASDRRVDHLCDLLKRVVEYILQEDAGTFLWRQREDEMLNCAANT